MFKIEFYRPRLISFVLFFMAMMFLSSCATKRSYSHKSRTKTNRSYKKTTKPRTSTKRLSSDDKLRNQLINTAKKYIGTKYVYGGKRPGGFDCSGFITYVMNQNGVQLSGSSSMIAKKGMRKSKTKLKTGDLIFFGKGSKVSHIAMVVENNNGLKVIHSTSSRGVVIDEISSSTYWQKKYLFGKSII